MNPLFIVLCILFVSASYGEFCPDCGKKVNLKQTACTQCGFSLKSLWGWWEAQRRSIPGLHISRGPYKCPHCQKIHKKVHFFCFHCGKALLKRVSKESHQASANRNGGFTTSNGGLKELLEKAGRDPGSLTEDQKASLVNWVRQKPFSVLFKDADSAPDGRRPAFGKQFGNFQGTKIPMAPDFLLQQLKAMQGR